MKTIVDHWVQIVDVTSVIEGTPLGLRKLGVRIGALKSILTLSFWRLDMFVCHRFARIRDLSLSRFILPCHA